MTSTTYFVLSQRVKAHVDLALEPLFYLVFILQDAVRLKLHGI